MAENGYAPAAGPGHFGKIPNYGKTYNNPMGNVEPPACIQNAMMTKDKKPFTYTPGGLDLSQIRTPSMARRLARQRSQEEHEQANYNTPRQANVGGYNPPPQGGGPPPPPPPPANAPPPPPPLIIEAPNMKSPKPPALGERPEIVIPENPIGMLRKTNSPYHWESEQADMQRIGPVPKFVEKVPSPLTVKMPPSSFSQQPPQTYTPQPPNAMGRSSNSLTSSRTPDSPVHKPEPMYAHQQSASPSSNAFTPTRDILQRQDSQFNKSPMPFANTSPISNGTSFSPSPNSSWRQPERRESPATNISSPSPQRNRAQFSPPKTAQYSPTYQTHQANTPPAYHTLPRAGVRPQDSYANNISQPRENSNILYNNTNDQVSHSPNNATPWRTNTLNRNPREQVPILNSNNNQSWKDAPEVNTNQEPFNSEWKGVPNQQQQYNPPWVVSRDQNNNRVQDNNSPPWRHAQDANNNRPDIINTPQEQPRFQSHISIPVTPRKPRQEIDSNPTPPPTPQKEAVYVTQEPVYFCPDSPNSIPPWVKTQKEKTKSPPPVWCQRPLEPRKSLPRELVTPPRDGQGEPEWVKKSNDMQRNIREVISPPKYQQPVQATWSTKPSDNRKSLPRDNDPSSPGGDLRNENRYGEQPQLRIVIDMQSPSSEQLRAQAPYSQPTQRIMRVLSPQLVRMDEAPPPNELPTLNTNYQTYNSNGDHNQQHQPKTRIIPIKLEGGGNEGPNKRVYYHKFVQEGPPRQSRAFRVLQVITGTEDSGSEQIAQSKIYANKMKNIESQHGFTDL